MEMLSVYPNPYFALDEAGEPAGAVPVDPIGHSPDRRFVGAQVERVEILDGELAKGDLRAQRQNTHFSFSKEPVKIPVTGYYLMHLRQGHLWPADEKTARLAGLEYTPKDELEAKAKEASIAEYETLYGKGSHPTADGPEPGNSGKAPEVTAHAAPVFENNPPAVPTHEEPQ